MIIQIIFLLYQTVTCYAKPRLFLLGYLLYHTAFLGFIDKEILINGSDVGLFYQSFLMLVCVVARRRELRLLPKILKRMTGLLLLLYVYAIINPILFSNSTFIDAITASKEFSVYVLLSYLFCSHISYALIEKALTYIGIYLLAVLFVYSLSGWCPEYYLKGSNGIEIEYPTLISVFLFIRASESVTLNKRLVFIGLIALWVYGMLSEGHISILVLTVFFTLVIVFVPFLKTLLKNFRTVLFSIIAVGVVLEITIGLASLYEYAISSSELASRAFYNEPRLEKIGQNPLVGLGFVHKNVMIFSDTSIYMESLSVIDSGYIDLLGKFGFLGTILFTASMFYYMLKLKDNRFSFSAKLFLVQYFALCITWSVFSFGFGILPLVLLMYIIHRKENVLKSAEVNPPSKLT